MGVAPSAQDIPDVVVRSLKKKKGTETLDFSLGDLGRCLCGTLRVEIDTLSLPINLAFPASSLW